MGVKNQGDSLPVKYMPNKTEIKETFLHTVDPF